jgi:acetyl/propionyl-CoA carboxylase alpha subunit
LIQSILIANRGEIARRIIRTCRRMGIRAVAVYSDADVGSAHVEEADAAVHLGPAPADSYLNIPALLDAARRAGADAIHPGYGFLAENADFARACAAAGLVFVGPSPEAIAAMGDKRAARRLAERVGAARPARLRRPGDQNEATLRSAKRRESLGYPLMVKAAAGGGGRGHAPGERARTS